MAKPKTTSSKPVHTKVVKKTNQGGRRPKTSSMNKSQRRNFKRNRGQGR